MVALGGTPLPYEVLARAADVDAGALSTRLGSLRAAQLVRVIRRGDERLVEPYHDRIREAVLSQLRRRHGVMGLAALHLSLARALRAAMAADRMEHEVFTIVQHLEASLTLLGPAERPEFAELELLASKQAQRATAYERAAEHARVGLGGLGPSAWASHYVLSRDLHFAQLSAEYLAGARGQALATFQAARAHVRGEADRSALCCAWIVLVTNGRQLDSAVAIGRERLAELGIELPERVSPDELDRAHQTLLTLRAGRAVTELGALPEAKDELACAAIPVLSALIPVSFFLDSSLSAWIKLKAVSLSLQHGVCDGSAYAFSGYGSFLSSAMGEHAQGMAFGRLALSLNERFGRDELSAGLTFLLGGWHSPWAEPFAAGKALLRRAQELAYEHGDPAHETYAATVLSVLTFCESSQLAMLEQTARWAREIAIRRKDDDMAGVPEAHARYAAALQGCTDSPRDLGTTGDSDAAFRERLGPGTPVALFYYLFCNAELAFLFGDAKRASSLLMQAKELEQVIFGLPTMVELRFLACLVAARRHRDATPSERCALRQECEAHLADLARWARSCPANFEPHYLIVKAELARLNPSTAAREAYDLAIDAARAHRAPKREAIALELAAEQARTEGDRNRFVWLHEAACDAYRRWGALAKVHAIRPQRRQHEA